MGEEKGRAYLRELAKQNIANLRGSAREVLDQVIAGEYAIALQIFNHHAVISAKKGAPVDWIKMEPATGTLSVISIHKNAPHPNAAKLLVDFIISKEGQEVFRDADYITAHPGGAGARADARSRRKAISACGSSRRSRPKTTCRNGRRFPTSSSAKVRQDRSEGCSRIVAPNNRWPRRAVGCTMRATNERCGRKCS